MKEYWVIDPSKKNIVVFENTDNEFKVFEHAQSEGLVKSKILDGFSVSILTMSTYYVFNELQASTEVFDKLGFIGKFVFRNCSKSFYVSLLAISSLTH